MAWWKPREASFHSVGGWHVPHEAPKVTVVRIGMAADARGSDAAVSDGHASAAGIMPFFPFVTGWASQFGMGAREEGGGLAWVRERWNAERFGRVTGVAPRAELARCTSA